MPAAPSALPRRWYAQCAERLMHLWFLKAAGTAAFMGIFFYSYFAVLRSPLVLVTVMPITRIDEWMAFWPPAFYLYASLWVYTALVPALQPTLLRLVAYGGGIGALCLSGLLIFAFFPTTVPYVFSDWFIDPSLTLLRRLDAPGNAWPSLHVATAIFTAMCLHRLLRGLGCPRWAKAANWAWCVLIIYSTMAIKQHVLWDVLAGIVLGLLFGGLYLKFEKRLAD